MNGSDLAVRDLVKSYGPNQVLRGVNLTVPAGRIHALVGENGAGKSTLIKILSGVTAQDAGHVSIGGVEARPGRIADARRLGVRVVYQELSTVPNLSVGENLLFGDEPHLGGIVRSRAVHAKAAELLQRLGMGRLDPRAPVSSLDLADRQLLEIAKALAAQPRVLILDEATSALSAHDSEWVLEQARASAAAGAVVLVITHRLAEIRSVADTMTVLRAGENVLDGPLADYDDDQVIAEMLGRRVERLFPERSKPGEQVVLTVSGGRIGSRIGPMDLELRRGEVFGLGGLQGQGQRDVLRALAGAARWTGGVVTLNGAPYAPKAPAEAIARRVTYVPEDRQREGLLLSQLVRHNISLAHLRSVSRRGLLSTRTEDARSRAVARQTGIPDNRHDVRVSALSGGNQQKVVLGKALFDRPAVLLLHDCTRGVDVGTKAEIFALIAQLSSEGVAVVFYSSDLSELVHVCHRVLVMAEGRPRGILDAADGQLSEHGILRLAVGQHEGDAVPLATVSAP